MPRFKSNYRRGTPRSSLGCATQRKREFETHRSWCTCAHASSVLHYSTRSTTNTATTTNITTTTTDITHHNHHYRLATTMAPGPHAGNRFRPAYSSTPRFEYPPLILDAFSPRPPLPYVPPAKARRLRPLDGVAAFMATFEKQPSAAAAAAAAARAAYPTPARKRQERVAKRRAARREAVAAAKAAWEAKQQRLAAAAASAAEGKKGGSGKSSDDAMASEASKAGATADGSGPTAETGENGAAIEEDDAELVARFGNLYKTVFVANLVRLRFVLCQERVELMESEKRAFLHC